MNGWRAFQLGISRTIRYWWVVLILFGVNLLSALSLAVLPAGSLASQFGHRIAIQAAADGVDAWLVVETLMSPLSSGALGGQSVLELANWLQQITLLGLLTALVLPLLAWLPAAFLTGGLLLTYVEVTQPFRWRRFLWGCWHWWGAFLLLGVMQGILVILLLLPLTGAVVGLVAIAGGWSAWVGLPLLTVVVAVGLAWIEGARIAAVLGGMRNPFHALGLALRFTIRHLPAVGVLYGLALALLGLLHILFRGLLLPRLPLDGWLLVLVVQQIFILARLWARLVRLAGGAALYRDSRIPRAADPPAVVHRRDDPRGYAQTGQPGGGSFAAQTSPGQPAGQSQGDGAKDSVAKR
ncbi:MAG TPA: hypothetical protein ENN99_02020 [Chloroflexi bacterium]|nr:hypothetical protein [Chloroflexota bacterium]